MKVCQQSYLLYLVQHNLKRSQKVWFVVFGTCTTNTWIMQLLHKLTATACLQGEPKTTYTLYSVWCVIFKPPFMPEGEGTAIAFPNPYPHNTLHKLTPCWYDIWSIQIHQLLKSNSKHVGWYPVIHVITFWITAVRKCLVKVKKPVVHCLVLVCDTPEVFPAIHIPRADTHANIGPHGVFKMAITKLAENRGGGWGIDLKKEFNCFVYFFFHLLN